MIVVDARQTIMVLYVTLALLALSMVIVMAKEPSKVVVSVNATLAG